jgi:tetratricopeptide (TPR) repeat protein
VKQAKELAARGSRYAEFEFPNLITRMARAAAEGLVAERAERAFSEIDGLKPAGTQLSGAAKLALAQTERWRGEFRLSRREFDDAAQAVEAGLAILPPMQPPVREEAAHLHALAGRILEQRGKMEDAKDQFQRAEALFRECGGGARIGLLVAQMQAAQGERLGTATLQLKEIVARQPWSGRAHQALANAYRRLGDPKQAAWHLKAALAALPPPDPDALAPGAGRRKLLKDLAEVEVQLASIRE